MIYLKLLRVKHYIKNILIMIPLMFSGSFMNLTLLLKAIYGFCIFSLISSAVYIFNDISDVEKDRLHPKKKKRPIASGKVSIRTASVIAVSCICLSVILQICLLSYLSGICIIVYIAINYIYSKGLKNKPIIDIILLVSGFFIRLLYGAMVTGISISSWLYLTVITGAFYMSLGKRRNESKLTGKSTRTVLKYYTYEFLDKNMYVCMALLNTFYALWASEKGTLFLITVPIVMIISMKYSYSIESQPESDGDPVSVLLDDKLIMTLGLFYSIYMFIILYSNIIF